MEFLGLMIILCLMFSVTAKVLYSSYTIPQGFFSLKFFNDPVHFTMVRLCCLEKNMSQISTCLLYIIDMNCFLVDVIQYLPSTFSYLIFQVVWQLFWFISSEVKFHSVFHLCSLNQENDSGRIPLFMLQNKIKVNSKKKN